MKKVIEIFYIVDNLCKIVDENFMEKPHNKQKETTKSLMYGPKV
jgi:hypothetical protein